MLPTESALCRCKGGRSCESSWRNVARLVGLLLGRIEAERKNAGERACTTRPVKHLIWADFNLAVSPYLIPAVPILPQGRNRKTVKQPNEGHCASTGWPFSLTTYTTPSNNIIGPDRVYVVGLNGHPVLVFIFVLFVLQYSYSYLMMTKTIRKSGSICLHFSYLCV